MNVTIKLDESKYGNTSQGTKFPLKEFYYLGKNSKEEFITARHCDGLTLIAVTKQQFNQWKNLKILSRGVQ